MSQMYEVRLNIRGCDCCDTHKVYIYHTLASSMGEAMLKTKEYHDMIDPSRDRSFETWKAKVLMGVVLAKNYRC